MKTAKSLGFKKGDFVMSPMFPAIITGHANTATPSIEAWGWEHECGSAYAVELRMISPSTFIRKVMESDSRDGVVYSADAKKAMKEAGILNLFESLVREK